MKSIFKIRTAISLAMCMAFALTFFTGCDKSDGGNSMDVRDGYTGTYRVHEVVRYMDGSVDTDDYNSTITKSSANNKDLIITNILNAGAGISVIITVDGDSFTIPQQSITVEGIGAGLSGSGRRTGNSLNFSVFVNLTGFGQVNYECSASKL